MFGIIQDARKGKGIKSLALVDRARCRTQWWTTDDPNIALCYEKKSAAEFAARRLKRNSARVVPFVRVQQILNEQRARRWQLESEWDQDNAHRQALHESESGWDGHKAYAEAGE